MYTYDNSLNCRHLADGIGVCIQCTWCYIHGRQTAEQFRNQSC